MDSIDGVTEYTYDALGQLLTEVKDGTKILWEKWECNTLIPLYDNEDSVCGIIYNGVPYYFHKNLQGDIIAIADQNGKVVARYTYDAWGKCEISVKSTNAAVAEINPYRYRGYYFDTETGFYYLQSRYYDPEIGRFINADIAFLVVTTDAKCKGNLFAYCENDSVNQIDIMGFATAETAMMGFAIRFGYSLVGKALLKTLTSFLLSCFPYLVAVVAAIATAYLIYVIAQKAIVKSVKKKIPNRLLKNGKVDLKKFNKNRKGRPGKQEEGGYYIEPDYAKHAGSLWKLFNKAGQRIASLFGDGSIRGK